MNRSDGVEISATESAIRVWACASVTLSVVLSVVFGVFSAWHYAGGNFVDEQATGYSFLRNFICDSFPETARNGATNVLGSRFAMISYLIIIWLGGVPIWGIIPRRWIRSGRLRSMTTLMAILAGGGASILPVSYLLHWVVAHQLLVIAAMVPTLISTIWYTILAVLEAESSRWEQVSGWAFLGAIAGNLVVWGLVEAAVIPLTTLSPALQKAALVSLWAWMLLMSSTQSRLNQVPKPVH